MYQTGQHNKIEMNIDGRKSTHNKSGKGKKKHKQNAHFMLQRTADI